MSSTSTFERTRLARVRRFCAAVLAAMLLCNHIAAAQSVRGQVQFRNGYPAAGVAVRVANARLGPSGMSYTGYDGMYYLNGIPPGDYRLEVYVNGHAVPPRQIRVFNQPGTDIPPYRLPW